MIYGVQGLVSINWLLNVTKFPSVRFQLSSSYVLNCFEETLLIFLYTLILKAGGVLMLPASTCLSVCPSVCIWDRLSRKYRPQIEAGIKWLPFADNIFKFIFFYVNSCILIQISLKFVPKTPIGYKSALVEIMTWHQISSKPLFEPSLVQIMACRLFRAKPSSQPMLTYCQLHSKEHISVFFFYWKSKVLIQWNAFQHVACKVAAILCRPQCVNFIKQPIPNWLIHISQIL